MKPSELFNLSGKTAVIIGGTGELCGAMSEGFAAAGAHVVLVGRDATKAEKRTAAITANGGKVSFESCEVTSRSALEDLARRVSDQLGKMAPGSTARRPFSKSAKMRWIASSISTSKA